MLKYNAIAPKLSKGVKIMFNLQVGILDLKTIFTNKFSFFFLSFLELFTRNLILLNSTFKKKVLKSLWIKCFPSLKKRAQYKTNTKILKGKYKRYKVLLYYTSEMYTVN